MSASIFSNSNTEVKVLKSNLSINDTMKWLSGTADPSSSAVNAPRGSLYSRTGGSGGQIYRKKDDGLSTNWEIIGSGSGGTNYITEPGAEASVGTAAAYADAAGATPVDGTGGSPTVTITRTTSSPLYGNGSYLITKDAANRQGEGVSWPFTIQRGDQSKTMSILFDYEVASGTFTAGGSSDLRVFIYDVTNAGLIAVTPITIGAVSGAFYGTFQTASNSLSYRLIVHVATTSALAYTFKMDQVTVTPQLVVYGGDPDVVAAQVALAANYTTGTDAPLIFDTVLSDTHSGYSVVTGQYTAPVSGYYRVSVSALSTAGTANLILTLNGVQTVYLAQWLSTGTRSGSQTILATAGQTIEVQSDGALEATGMASAPYICSMSIERIAGTL